MRPIIYHCVVCWRFEGPACRAPPPPPLPEFRVREEPPFLFTGVDFAGPLYIRSFGLTVTNKVLDCERSKFGEILTVWYVMDLPLHLLHHLSSSP